MLKTTFLKLSAATLGAALWAGAAFADARTEAYVEENANEVLKTLNDPALDSTARTEAFSRYMDQFTDLDAVSNFVIGRYAREFSEDELASYRAAFRTYALAVYENELDRYRGESVEVIGSFDRTARDSIVNTRIPREGGPAMDVRWRVLNRGGEYQVVDVALNIEGNLLWLAIEQRAQFLALLDRTNGSSDALIAKIEEMTNTLESNREFESSFDGLEAASSNAETN
ncbi:MAG: ABC transporter substrate-binding protein [Pseudomonadota bacterium]